MHAVGGPYHTRRQNLESGGGGNFFNWRTAPSSRSRSSLSQLASNSPPSAPQLSLWPALATVVVATIMASIMLMLLVASVAFVVSLRREGAEARGRAEAESSIHSAAAAAFSRLPLPPLVEAPLGSRIAVHPDRKMALALPEEVV